MLIISFNTCIRNLVVTTSPYRWKWNTIYNFCIRTLSFECTFDADSISMQLDCLLEWPNLSQNSHLVSRLVSTCLPMTFVFYQFEMLIRRRGADSHLNGHRMRSCGIKKRGISVRGHLNETRIQRPT